MAGAQGSRRRRRRRGKRSIAGLIILLAALVVLVIALWNLLPILLDYRQADAAYQDLAGQIVDLGPEEDGVYGDLSAEDSYDWASVTIDFDALWRINPDVVAWIRFDDTEAVNVDYPVLHASDNDLYLRTDLYGESHISGSIFLEAANSPDMSDLYNIIYGHNMRNGTMFGTLRKFRDSDDFYENNSYFTIYTPQSARRYRIFSYGEVRDDSEIYAVGFAPDAAYQQLINVLLSTSYRNTGIVPAVDDQIVTLSTCTSRGDDYRFIVCGVCVGEKLY